MKGREEGEEERGREEWGQGKRKGRLLGKKKKYFQSSLSLGSSSLLLLRIARAAEYFLPLAPSMLASLSCVPPLWDLL